MLYEAKKKKVVEFLKGKFMVMQKLGMHKGRKNEIIYVKYYQLFFLNH